MTFTFTNDKEIIDLSCPHELEDDETVSVGDYEKEKTELIRFVEILINEYSRQKGIKFYVKNF